MSANTSVDSDIPPYEHKLKDFAVELFKINAIKFGEFKTKVGLMTPVYCDLRVIVSYPKVLAKLTEILKEYLEYNLNIYEYYDLICGVPYTALPIATLLSVQLNLPMVMRRKEAKDYGTKKLIEGVYQEDYTCIIIEDVVTSGSSILETVKDLKDNGIICYDAMVVLNREQGGKEILKSKGVRMLSLYGLTEFMGYLREANCIDDEMVQKVKTYLEETQVNPNAVIIKPHSSSRLQLSFLKRAELAKNKVASELFKIMAQKETNLCVAADLTLTTDLLNFAEQVGPHICTLKLHIDILDDFHPNFLKQLKEIAVNHNFLLFADRKFCDIGKTVELQYSKGIYQVSTWAQLVTAHSVTGKGVLEAIKQAEGVTDRGVFLLAETSAAGSLICENYTKNTVELALQFPELVTGIVCQSPLFLDNPGLIQLTPGIQIGSTSDNLGQQYNNPEHAVLKCGADIAVVGRGITKATDVRQAAANYKKLLWDAYLKRIEKKSD